MQSIQQNIIENVIRNSSGMTVKFINIGASITEIIVPDRDGNNANVVLKHNDVNLYYTNNSYLGATIGRYANRIADGSISIAGKCYQLTINETSTHNHLHGGFEGFSRKKWNITAQRGNAICFEYLSVEGEEGYPGNLQTMVSYELDDYNCLHVRYTATCDRSTIVNLTNHSYFNLSGGMGNIFDHTLWINASKYTPLNDRNLPLGYEALVKDTIFDLQKDTEVGAVAERIVNASYCINRYKKLTKAAVLLHNETGRKMTIYATMPGLQVYFGNFLTGYHKPFSGICLEPHYYPNAPNVRGFKNPLLQPGELYDESIVYHFETIIK